MQKLAALSLLLVCMQPVAGMRVGTRKSTGQMAASAQADSTSKYDLFLCDQMCMQCPSGRNILIQRQKSGAKSILSVGAGLLSFGWGTAIVNQLAGCDKIGFQFWQDHELAQEQPLETQSTLGVLFVHSGLEVLQASAGKKQSSGDQDALEHCESLSRAYVWQALHGAFESGGFARQQEFARKCLSHSQLCGTDLEWDHEELGEDAELKVSRLNPFANQGMCAAPNPKGVDEGGDLSDYEKALRDAAGGGAAGTDGASGDTGRSSAPCYYALDADLKDKCTEGSLEISTDSNCATDACNTDADFAKCCPGTLRPQWTRKEGEEGLGHLANCWQMWGSWESMDESCAGQLKCARKGHNDKTFGDCESHHCCSVDPSVEVEVEKRPTDALPISGGSVEKLTSSGGSGNSGNADFKPAAIATDAMLSAVTVEEAGKLLDEAVINDDTNEITSKFCRSDKQQARCAQLGLINPAQCTDRCCLDVCNFYNRVQASCIHKCTKGH